MRISNFSVFNYNLKTQQNSIADTQKIIEQGRSYTGFNGVRNTQMKLHRDTSISMYNSQINTLNSVEHNMNIYDTNLQEMKTNINKINVLLIKKENDTLNQNGKNAISQEINSIIENIKTLENANLNDNEKLYSNNNFNSEVIVGNNDRNIRAFNTDLISINSIKISKKLETVDLSNIKEIQDKIDYSIAVVGLETNDIQSKRNLKVLGKLEEERYFGTTENSTENIIKLQDKLQTYQASLLMISKVQKISLVNYL